MINVLDGIDVLAMAFAAPAVSREWSLGAAETGFLLSAGLAGITAGSIILSPFADILGRRALLLAGVGLATTGMLATATSHSFQELIGWRLMTGFGIGALTSTIGILAVEYASPKRREAALSSVTIGFPVGAALGGLAANQILLHFDWRAIFVAGGSASAILLVVLIFLLPESTVYLTERRPPRALDRINRIRARSGAAHLETLPEIAGTASSPKSVFDIVRPPLLTRTIQLSIINFSFMATYLFIISWAPKFATQLGRSDSDAVLLTSMISLGGAIGCLAFALLSMRLKLRPTLFALFAALGTLVTVFPWALRYTQSSATLPLALALGLPTYACGVCIYAVIVGAYPPSVRATGAGLTNGLGRLGGAIGPYAAGLIMAQGLSISGTCAIMSLPMAIAAILLSLLPATYFVREKASSSPERGA